MGKKISNKEIINNLIEFFMENDPREVARALAGMMMDIDRIMTIGQLSGTELKSLLVRMDLNRKALIDFIENGPKGKFKCHTTNSDDLKD